MKDSVVILYASSHFVRLLFRALTGDQRRKARERRISKSLTQSNFLVSAFIFCIHISFPPNRTLLFPPPHVTRTPLRLSSLLIVLLLKPFTAFFSLRFPLCLVPLALGVFLQDHFTPFWQVIPSSRKCLYLRSLTFMFSNHQVSIIKIISKSNQYPNTRCLKYSHDQIAFRLFLERVTSRTRGATGRGRGGSTRDLHLLRK